ncbi:Xaa-Pro peptidase family protein [Caldalkalibacillus salinus]|uniref:M24 family metallopeptidase n=1 Tax=Caldalkalibacillus salinus TaxID=2803787 RepID=UPI0030199501
MSKKIDRLRAQFEAEGIDAILVTSRTNLRYVTGFTGTAGVALVTERDAIFITDFRYVSQAEEQVQDFRVIKHNGALGETIASELQQQQVQRLGFEQDHVTFRTYREYETQFQDSTLVPVSQMIEKLRLVKDHEEIGMIKKAVHIADQTFEHILKFVRPGMQEIEVANEIEFHMRKLGATSSSFDIIVASGYRSALPHGVASDKKIERGDFITLDFGALYQGYVSDMTRTFALGTPDPKLKDIYDVCLQAQLRGVEQIKAGMTGKEADAICRDYITEKGYGEYFGHSTGHGMGLDVHEGPSLSTKSNIALEPGMVVTVEPGIYLSGIGGVRIEDDIVVTEHGNEILTTSTKELLVVE